MCLGILSIILSGIHVIQMDSLIQYMKNRRLILEWNGVEFWEVSEEDSKGNSNGGIDFIWPIGLWMASYDLSGMRLNYHTGGLFGMSCISWCGHLIHVSIPISRGKILSLGGVGDIFSTILDKDNHMWGSSLGSGSCYFS
jgi:hypothetical protein